MRGWLILQGSSWQGITLCWQNRAPWRILDSFLSSAELVQEERCRSPTHMQCQGLTKPLLSTLSPVLCWGDGWQARGGESCRSVFPCSKVWSSGSICSLEKGSVCKMFLIAVSSAGLATPPLGKGCLRTFCKNPNCLESCSTDGRVREWFKRGLILCFCSSEYIVSSVLNQLL